MAVDVYLQTTTRVHGDNMTFTDINGFDSVVMFHGGFSVTSSYIV